MSRTPPSSDALYLFHYVSLIAGLACSGVAYGAAPARLFPAVALLGLATLWSWLVFSRSQRRPGGTAAVATTLAYPLLDLLLLASALIGLAARDWRSDWASSR